MARDAGPPAGPGGRAARRTLGRSQRLTRPTDFRDTFAEGVKITGRYLVMWARPSTGTGSRLGVVASKRSIGKAVRRVRAKRRLREVFRAHRPRFAAERDVVMVARRGLLDAEWKDLERDFRQVAGRAGLLVDGDEKE